MEAEAGPYMCVFDKKQKFGMSIIGVTWKKSSRSERFRPDLVRYVSIVDCL